MVRSETYKSKSSAKNCIESVQTADEVMRQADRHGIDLPISSAVRAVLHGDLTPRDGLQQLLSREQKPEYPETLFK